MTAAVRRRRAAMTGLASLVVVCVTVFAAQRPPAADPVSRLRRVVEDYYTRAKARVTEETVVVQPLASDLTGGGFPRRAVYEVRVEWDAAAPTSAERAIAVRQLTKATGPALFDPGDEECGDPPSI